MVSFPRVLKMVSSLVTGCPEVAHSVGRLREHFMYIHFFLRIVVVQEGKDPLPHCDLYGMYMSEGRLIKHHRMQQCNRNIQMRWQRRDVLIASQYAEAYFSLAGKIRRNASRVWRLSNT